MANRLTPAPDGTERAKEAERRRAAAAALSTSRPRVDTKANDEIDHYATHPTNFHKGLPHNAFGIVDEDAFQDFVGALNRDVAAGTNAAFVVPLGPREAIGSFRAEGAPQDTGVATFFSLVTEGKAPEVRNWESPLAGHVYSLQGPDAGAVGVASAPRIPYSELCAEMGEVYAMALLRDVPFAALEDTAQQIPEFDAKGKQVGNSDGTVGRVFDSLSKLSFLDPSGTPFNSKGSKTLNEQERRRRDARFKGGGYTPQVMFRGSTVGAKEGPYLSQFMLMGSNALLGRRNPGAAADGLAPQAGQVQHRDLTASSRDPRISAKVAFPPGLGAAAGIAASDTMATLSAGYGLVTYGAQSVQQRISAQLPGRDYMTDWPLWLDVQNGADTRDAQEFFKDDVARFIHTPRGLATYVHFDALYQAYFVACLLMLDAKVPFDHGFPSGPYHATRGSFAVFGGPHILSLVTEVATRALKAVRRQKFQHHLRGRPEQLAAMLTLAASDQAETAFANDPDALKAFRQMIGDLQPLLSLVASHNAKQNAKPTFPKRFAGSNPPEGVDEWNGFVVEEDRNYLLPMAFPEGSPMHAAYGAGHATVAGACVTVLKAFFEMSTYTLPRHARLDASPLADPKAIESNAAVLFTPLPFASAFGHLGGNLFVPPVTDDEDDHKVLRSTVPDEGVTLQGELDKLAANVSIGRNMAGVHFYTDYYDSLRLGERVAVGILQEQMATYLEPLTMRLPTFDGDWMVISGDGMGGGSVQLVENGRPVSADGWWKRHVPG